MTTTELITMFAKGNDNYFGLSEKQMKWLISLAKSEGLLTEWGHGISEIIINKKHYKIKQGSVHVSGGSYVGKKSIARWSCTLHYHIKFTDTGLTAYYNHTDIEHYKMKGYSFEIL